MALWLGGLVPTGLISLILLRVVLRRWNGGVVRLIVAHAVSVVICVLIGAVGMADGGPLNWAGALVAYLPPQLFWLIASLWHQRRLHEPRRVCRRLQLLRGWSHDEASPPVFP